MATLWTTKTGAYAVRNGNHKNAPVLAWFRPDGTGWWTVEYPGGKHRMIFHKHDRTDEAELAAAQQLAARLFTP